MNGLELIVLISIVIILSVTLRVNSQSSGGSQSKQGPGISSCGYYGFFDEECSDIRLIPINSIPNECTSIFWDGLTVESDYNVTYAYTNGDDEGVLDILLKYDTPVYVFFGQCSQEVWAQVFGCDNSNAVSNTYKDMQGLKIYMDAHPGIVGLILSQLELDSDSTECKGYTDRLVSYINAMKKTFPDLEIGIELYGTTLLDYYASPTMEWLDFSVLDASVDFYVIDVCDLNDCGPEFRVNGSAPVTGDAPYTMTKVQKCLETISIPSDKTYYNIKLYATSDDIFELSCKRTYQNICTNITGTSSYCADTTQSFYEKGQFVMKNAAGFIGTNIDFADPFNACGCSHAFAPFYDILDGFNGSPAPESCTMDDR